MALCQTAELVCDYNQYGRLLSLIPEAGGVVTDTQFTDVVEISFQIPGESLPALNRKLADATSGSVQAQLPENYLWSGRTRENKDWKRYESK